MSRSEPSAAADSVMVAVKEEVTLVMVNASNALDVVGVDPSTSSACSSPPPLLTYLDLIRTAYDGLMRSCFAECLEEFEIWYRLLVTDPTSARYTLSFCVALRVTPNNTPNPPPVTLLGLAAVEHYKESQTLWLAYIAVEERARGMGIAKRMVRFIYSTLMIGGTGTTSSLPLQFILCAKRCHDAEDTIPPEVRHKLYTSLGFLPLALDFYDCGRLREEHSSALAVFIPEGGAISDGINRSLVTRWHGNGGDTTYPPALIIDFIKDLYTGILNEEGSSITNELDPYLALTNADTGKWCNGIPIGVQYWS